MSLSSSGTVIAVGARYNDGNGSNSGHVWVFNLNSTSAAWEQNGPDIDGEEAHDNSGFSVSLSGSGDLVAIGAIG